jgi:hypothetical protein
MNKPSRSFPMASAAFGLAAATALGLALTNPALAQWAWKDEAGRTVFSDQPPPASVKKEQIFRQPAANVIAAPTAPGAAAAASGASRAAAGPRTIAEQEQESRKRQQERADAEKKQAEQQANAARLQVECERARGYLRALEDGMRIARTDAQGNREVLDDEARNAEIARVRSNIAANCK